MIPPSYEAHFQDPKVSCLGPPPKYEPYYIIITKELKEIDKNNI